MNRWHGLDRFVVAAVIVLTGWATVSADDWPQWLGPQRDGIWRETGILDKFPAGGPKVRWRIPMGALFCFETKSGKVLWSKNFPKDLDARVPMWGFSAHPLLDGDKLICIVGGKGSVAVAFHKDTGKELWRALTASEPGYCPPMI